MLQQLRFSLLVSMVAMTACDRGQPSLVTVQLCLDDPAGVAVFKSILQDTAATANLSYLDGSKEAMESLMSTGEPLASLRDPSDLLSIHAHNDNDALAISAGNLGLSSYEVAVTFSGTNPDEVRRLAESVVGRLSDRWEVATVPEGRGAFPLADCGNL